MHEKRQGLSISGLMGTGKTTSLLFLYHRLKTNGRHVLQIASSSSMLCLPYLQWYCTGMFAVCVFPVSLY